MAQRQINIRLADEDVEVLETAAWLQRDALADLVRGVLLAHVEALRAQPRVRDALRLRAEEEAEERGVVTPIGRKRNSPEAG